MTRVSFHVASPFNGGTNFRAGLGLAHVGFTHITVSRRTDDAGAIWVLIESVDEARRGGLNVRVDSAKWEATMIDHWGKVTERREAAAPVKADEPTKKSSKRN